MAKKTHQIPEPLHKLIGEKKRGKSISMGKSYIVLVHSSLLLRPAEKEKTEQEQPKTSDTRKTEHAFHFQIG